MKLENIYGKGVVVHLYCWDIK